MFLSRPLRLALGVWMAVGVTVSVRAIVRPESHTVFPVLAMGSQHWWAGQPLYEDYDPLDYYRYSPTLAVCFSPLAWLGSRVGGVVWGWLNLVVYGAGLWAFARWVLPVAWSDTRLALYLCLGVFGGLRGLWNGQSNALIIGLLLLGVSATMRQRWWWAAFLFAGAILIKPNAAPPVLLLCALWPLRLTPRFIAAALVLAAVPFATRPFDLVLGAYRDWGLHLWETSSWRWVGLRDAYTVWQVATEDPAGMSLVDWLEQPLHSIGYRVLQLTTAFAALAWSQYLRWRNIEKRELVSCTLAIGLAWSMLFGPAVEHATFVLLIPVLCWGILDPGKGSARRLLIGAAFTLVTVLGWGALTRPYYEILPIAMLPLPIGTGLFVVWLAIRQYSSQETGASTYSQAAE